METNQHVLTDTDTATDNQVPMKNFFYIPILGFMPRIPEEALSAGNTVSELQIREFISPVLLQRKEDQNREIPESRILFPEQGGDGIYLQSVNTSSTAQKNTVQTATGFRIRV